MSKRKSSPLSYEATAKRRRSEDDDMDLSQNPDFEVNEVHLEILQRWDKICFSLVLKCPIRGTKYTYSVVLKWTF